MKFIASMIVAAFLMISCERGEFETRPGLRVLSATPDVVPVGGTLTVRLEYTDKEGDVDSTIYFIRRRENVRDASVPKERIIPLDIAAFPNTPRGEIELNLEYYFHITEGILPIPLPGGRDQPDTLSLSFFVADEKGNRSDTVALDRNIVVIR